MTTKPNEAVEEIVDKVNKLFPCLDGTCDLNGTAIISSDGVHPEPVQCEYCHRERFPKLKEIRIALTQAIQTAREEERERIESELPNLRHVMIGEERLISEEAIKGAITNWSSYKQVS